MPRNGPGGPDRPRLQAETGTLGTLRDAIGKGGFGLIYIERQRPGLLLTR